MLTFKFKFDIMSISKVIFDINRHIGLGRYMHPQVFEPALGRVVFNLYQPLERNVSRHRARTFSSCFFYFLILTRLLTKLLKQIATQMRFL